ncbi:ATP-grasp domain-containing protein [Aliivibrio fischeri]|uniref:ATP-grasp domain-containing protein n=1 Tax=Aliivibrio fischeri TaxID=668 RepID=UPI0009BE41C3|nr:ATP-grasp domain-containing protein [Aliivibrio fischeri]
MENKVLIINPASSGKMIRPIMQQAGIECDVFIDRDSDPKELLNLDTPSLYDNEVTSLDISEIKGKYDAVIAGSELGITLCDETAHKLNLAGNSPKTTNLRRNKFEMQKALKDNSLSYIESFLISENCNGLNKINSLKTTNYIVKPIDSAGSEDVNFCQSKNELINKVSSLPWGMVNSTGQINNEFIVQEFVTGDEYVIDFMVINSKPFVRSVCKYVKGGKDVGKFAYRRLLLLEPSLPELSELLSYAKKAVNALDIKHGPVHMELLLNDIKGPVMIEAATRLHGGVAPSIFAECYSPGLLESLVATVKNDNNHLKDSNLTKFGQIYFHVNKGECIYNGLTNKLESQIRALDSVMDLLFTIQPGTTLNKTVDLFTCPVLVWLSNENKEALESDIATLENLLNLVFETNFLEEV